MPRSASEDKPRDRIYSELRHAIMMGHRLPGERLSVDSLAAAYGASITPVRDALHRLSETGLVTIKPRSGYYVASITLKQLRDMLELYEILELASIERAVQRITPQQVAALEAWLHDDETAANDSPETRVVRNKEFHLMIARATGNLELVESLERVHNRLVRFMIICSAVDTLHSSHSQIIESLRTRDTEMAREALLRELQELRTTILEYVIQTEGDSWFLAS